LFLVPYGTYKLPTSHRQVPYGTFQSPNLISSNTEIMTQISAFVKFLGNEIKPKILRKAKYK